MTTENQLRRNVLSEIENAVRETLARQPVEGDEACAEVLESGLVRINEMLHGYFCKGATA